VLHVAVQEDEHPPRRARRQRVHNLAAAHCLRTGMRAGVSEPWSAVFRKFAVVQRVRTLLVACGTSAQLSGPG